MFLRLLFTFLLATPTIIFGQATDDAHPGISFERVTGASNLMNNLKMLCDPATSDLVVLSCSGETSNSNNGNASDGASMTWMADGSQNLYYSQIYNGTDTFRIVQGTTGDATYEPDDDGSYTADLAIANGVNACLSSGTWTVRVWDVMDDDNDGNPDVDDSGEIIGCFAECTYTFFPVCPAQVDNAFTATIEPVSCAGDDGSIRLRNFSDNRFYCSDGTGVDLGFTWAGPGGFSATTRDLTGLAQGEYNVTVTDFYGCSQINSFTVGEQSRIALTCGATTPPSSIFQTNGTAMYTIDEGVGPFNLTFTGPSNGSRNNVPEGNNTLFNLDDGTYTLTVTDVSTGCTDVCTIVVDPPPCLVNFTVDYTLGPDGIEEVIIIPTGGSANFVLTWTGPTNSTSPIDGIPNPGITLPGSDFTFGTYTFTLREQFRMNCFTDIVVTFDPPNCDDIIITLLQVVTPSCNGGADGTIELDVSGGENTEIEWSGPGVNGVNAILLEDLAAGTYTYLVTDDRGCSITNDVILLNPSSLTFTCVATDETANDNDDGMITLDIGGGTPGYTLTYSGVDAGGNPIPGGNDFPVLDGDVIPNLQSGTYSLTLTDANGCTIDCSSLIEQPDCDVPIFCDPTQPTVFGGTGSVSITATDGSEFAYDLLRQPGDMFVTGDLEGPGPRVVSDLTPGQYTVNAFNFGGCTGSCSFEIFEAPCDLQAVASVFDVTCSGGSDGSANLNITGSTTGLTIIWGRPEFDGMTMVSGLSAGSYPVSISDDGGCPAIDLIVVIGEPAPLTANITQTMPILCAGDETAVLRANTTGGVGDLSYSWSDPTFPDNPVVTGVGTGPYIVTVTDENGCVGTSLAYTVLEPTALQLTCAAVDETELGNEDGKIGFTVTGGVAPYTLLFEGVPVTRPAMDTFFNLAPGTYTIAVMDDNGCTDNCVATVPRGGCGPFALTLDTTQPDCDNETGSATANTTDGTGDIEYQWSHGPTTRSVSDLIGGQYTVTVTDELGCTDAGSLFITDFDDAPSATIGQFTPSCAGVCTTISGTFSGSPPFTVDFVTGGTLPAFPLQLTVPDLALAQELCPGDFGLDSFTGATVRFVRVTDNNGCSRPLDELREFETLAAGLNRIEETRCPGDTLFIEGRTFQADTPSGTFTSATPTAAGCDSVIEVALTFLPAAVGTFSPMVCGTEPIVLGGETFSPTRPSGMVVLPGASSLGCDSTVMVSVTYLAPALSAQNPTICETGSFTVGAEVFDFDRPTGIVVLAGEAENGCDSIVDVSLSFAPPAVNVINAVLPPCDVLTVAGQDYNRAITDTTIVLAGAAAGGCDSTINLSIDILPEVSFVLTGTGLVCEDNLATVGVTYNGSGTATFSLSTAPMDIFSVQNGTSNFTVNAVPGTIISVVAVDDGTPCQPTISGEVTVAMTDLALTIDNRTNLDLPCGTDSTGILAALATGGQAPYGFAWSNGSDSPIQTALPGGNYFVTVTDGNNCTATALDSITERQAFGLDLNVSDPSCLDTFATIFIFDNIGGEAPFLYSVNGEAMRQVDSFPALARVRPGTSLLEVEDAVGCRTSRTFEFAEPDLPTIRLIPDRAVVPLGDSVLVTVDGSFPIDTFLLAPSLRGLVAGQEVWLRADGTPRFEFSAIDELGCTASASFQLVTDRSAPIYAPTAFSPNEDGVNDRFRLFSSPQVATINTVTIHDRWGAQVYVLDEAVPATEQFWGWAGFLPDGDLAPTGVYIYSATATLLNGQATTIRGEVTLVR